MSREKIIDERSILSISLLFMDDIEHILEFCDEFLCSSCHRSIDLFLDLDFDEFEGECFFLCWNSIETSLEECTCLFRES